MADITVVIPAFEARRFVGAAVESARRQFPGPTTVIVVDGSHQFRHENQDLEFLRQNFISGHVMARRERHLALGGFDESVRRTTEWAMWCDLLLAGGSVLRRHRHRGSVVATAGWPIPADEQTMESWELILVDDGSSDGSPPQAACWPPWASPRIQA